MRTQLWWIVAVLALLPLSQETARAQPDKAGEEAAILKNAEAFVEAFHKGDAKALAAFWTPDGDYTDQTGRLLKGREAIEKVFAKFFADHKGLKLRINIGPIRFVTGDVAIEDGITETIPPDGGPPSRARYTIVHVKKEGKWYLSSVRDAPYSPPTNYEHLSGLEWLIGNWADDSKDKGETARLAFSWAENQNFIVSSYATTFKNISLSSGTQWIGWDGAAKQIRLWAFDANGGIGEGSLTVEGDKVIVKASMVGREGKKVTATHIVTRLDPDTLTWESKDRTVEGKALPDVSPIKLKRLK
jgi:uncharacterized protein (TIGR02246 family)